MKVTATPVDEYTLEITATSVDILLLYAATRPGRHTKAELKRLEEFGTALATAANLAPHASAPKAPRKRKPKTELVFPHPGDAERYGGAAGLQSPPMGDPVHFPRNDAA